MLGSIRQVVGKLDQVRGGRIASELPQSYSPEAHTLAHLSMRLLRMHLDTRTAMQSQHDEAVRSQLSLLWLVNGATLMAQQAGWNASQSQCGCFYSFVCHSLEAWDIGCLAPPGGLLLTRGFLPSKRHRNIEFSNFPLLFVRAIFHSSVFLFRRKIIVKVFWNSEQVAKKQGRTSVFFGCLVSVLSISSPHGHLLSSYTLLFANVSFILAFLV